MICSRALQKLNSTEALEMTDGAGQIQLVDMTNMFPAWLLLSTPAWVVTVPAWVSLAAWEVVMVRGLQVSVWREWCGGSPESSRRQLLGPALRPVHGLLPPLPPPRQHPTPAPSGG